MSARCSASLREQPEGDDPEDHPEQEPVVADRFLLGFDVDGVIGRSVQVPEPG